MEKIEVLSDKALMASVDNENDHLLTDMKYCNKYTFNDSGHYGPETGIHSSGSTGSVFESAAN